MYYIFIKSEDYQPYFDYKISVMWLKNSEHFENSPKRLTALLAVPPINQSSDYCVLLHFKYQFKYVTTAIHFNHKIVIAKEKIQHLYSSNSTSELQICANIVKVTTSGILRLYVWHETIA